MKRLLFAFCMSFAFVGLNAQTPIWQPTPGHTQIPIWPGAMPDALPNPQQERLAMANDPKDLVAGKPWLSIEQVSRPTMTVYSPKGKNYGRCGGGFSRRRLFHSGNRS